MSKAAPRSPAVFDPRCKSFSTLRRVGSEMALNTSWVRMGLYFDSHQTIKTKRPASRRLVSGARTVSERDSPAATRDGTGGPSSLAGTDGAQTDGRSVRGVATLELRQQALRRGTSAARQRQRGLGRQRGGVMRRRRKPVPE